MLQNRDRRVSQRLKWHVQDRDGTGTWIRLGTIGICSSIHDPKGYHTTSAVVLANLKDNIGRFEARHIPKILKNSVAMENLMSSMHHFACDASWFL